MTSPQTASIGLDAEEALVDWAELEHIELVVLKRMKEYGVGSHPSVFHGEGFDFVGLRDWQPGDRLTDIDWPQSTLTNFSPLITREFEQNSTASMLIVADTSLSTRCGVNGVPIAKVIASAVATLSLAAAFFQDQLGLVTFDGPSRRMLVPPRTGRSHAIHCVETYQTEVFASTAMSLSDATPSLTGMLRRRSLVPVVSDFLFADAEALLRELAHLAALHDLFLVMVDSAFAYRLPELSAGWVEIFDVECGETRVVSSAELRDMAQAIVDWQEATERSARALGLEVVRVELGHEPRALTDFLGQRRLRKR